MSQGLKDVILWVDIVLMLIAFEAEVKFGQIRLIGTRGAVPGLPVCALFDPWCQLTKYFRRD